MSTTAVALDLGEDSHPLIYELDKKTGIVTMPDGFQFDVWGSPDPAEMGKDMNRIKAYMQERGLTGGSPRREITLDLGPAISTAAPEIADAELEHLAELALEADMEAKAAAEKQKAAKEAFKKALEVRNALNQNTRNVGVVRTVIKNVRRWDEKKAKELLNADEVERYSVKKLDSALVKRNVTPDTYELMQADFGYSLEVKVGGED
jgi:hypothetical protein